MVYIGGWWGRDLANWCNTIARWVVCVRLYIKWMKWFKLCAGKCVMAIWIQKMAMDWCNIIVCCNVFVKGCRSLSRKRKMFAKLLPIGVPIWQSTLVWSDDHWDWRSKRLSMDQFDYGPHCIRGLPISNRRTGKSYREGIEATLSIKVKGVYTTTYNTCIIINFSYCCISHNHTM